VVGVILTGGLDDGTIGLMRIKDEGGCAIVQDPDEAVFPGMCESAIANVDVDHVMPIAAIPAMLAKLASRPLNETEAAMSRNRQDVQDTAEGGQASLLTDTLPKGQASGIICPECGGALWEAENGKVTRFQCHVGHSYTADTLMAEKNSELENALWTALRTMEEAADLRRRTAARLQKAPFAALREKCLRESAELEQRAAVLRGALTGLPQVPHAPIDAKIKTRGTKSNGRAKHGQDQNGRRRAKVQRPPGSLSKSTTRNQR
jgi:two-component system chemotaxis response regulator CheB